MTAWLAAAEALRDRDLVTIDAGTVRPTDAGHVVADQVREHERVELRRIIDQWGGGDEPALDQLVDQLTARLWREDPTPAGLHA